MQAHQFYRYIFNFIYKISLYVPLLLLPAVMLAHEATFEDCDDLFVQDLRELLSDESDESRFILSKLYHLTSLKLAQQVRSGGERTLEDYVKRWEREIDRDLRSRPNYERVVTDLNELYKTHGIQNDYHTLLESFESARYWQSSLRFNPEEVSAFILGDYTLNNNSSFNQTDAAISWLVSEVTTRSLLQPGSAEYNQLNLSSRIVRFTGALSDSGANLSSSEIQEEIQHLYREFDEAFETFFQLFSDNYGQICEDWLDFQVKCFGRDFIFDFGLPESISSLVGDLDKVIPEVLASQLRLKFGDEFEFSILFNHSLSDTQRSHADVPIIQKLQARRFIEERREFDREVMSAENESEKIQLFHKHIRDSAHTQRYAIIERDPHQNQASLTFYTREGEILGEYSLEIRDDQRNDLRQKGGSGIYQYAYTSRVDGKDILYFSDQGKVNIGYSLVSSDQEMPDDELYELIKQVSAVYITPIEEGHYFRVKDDRLIFTSRNRMLYPGDYNFTPRRREYRPVLTIINNDEYRTSTSIEFMQTLDREKERLMQIYGLENDDYDDLARLAFGILGNESRFGESPKYKIKEAFPFVVSLLKGDGLDTSQNSRGPTQIKNVPRAIQEHYGVTKNSLTRPDHAAVATLGFLAEALSELRSRERHHPDITPENRVEYLHYLYMGRHDLVRNGTATPERNIYYRQARNYGQSLIQIDPRTHE